MFDGRPFAFTMAEIDQVPWCSGVYHLIDTGEIILIGCTIGELLPERLLWHYRGSSGLCTKAATNFMIFPSDEPEKLWTMHLTYHFDMFNRNPRCNGCFAMMN